MANEKKRSIKISEIKHAETSPFIPKLTENNPFIKAIRKKVREKKIAWLEGEKGEFIPKEMFVDTKNHVFEWGDEAIFTKIYHHKEAQNVFTKISGAGKSMLLFIATRLKKDNDVVKLYFEDYAEYAGIKSITAFYEPLINLFEAGVIIRKSGNDYYINPLILFNGDRSKLLGDPEEEYKLQKRLNNPYRKIKGTGNEYYLNVDNE